MMLFSYMLNIRKVVLRVKEILAKCDHRSILLNTDTNMGILPP